MFEFLSSIIGKIVIVVATTAISVAGFFGISSNNEEVLPLPEQEVVQEEILVEGEEIKEETKEETLVDVKEEENQNQNEKQAQETQKVVNLIAEAESLTEKLSNLVKEEVLKVTREEAKEEGLDISLSDLNLKVRDSVVNILCTTKSGGTLKPITGSGIIIDKKGVILTNAHVAQYFLLKDYQVADFITCTIRNGDNATSAYTANLLYISPSWVELHAKDIIKTRPTGTGQYDYALLLIDSPVSDGVKKPEEFPALPLETSSSKLNKEINVFLASYPAELLGGISVQKNLSLVSSTGEIKEYFTFSKTPPQGIDLISVSGNIVSQKGSSGGAIVSQLTGKLVGMITTSTDGEATEDRELQAITPYHINDVFTKETSVDLATLFAGNINSFAKAFEENEVPKLKQLFVGILDGNQ